jgi:hypothetical protein
MDGAIPTTPTKNTPKLPTPHLPPPRNSLPTYLPTYLLPFSKFMSALKTYQKLTYLPIQNYLSNCLHYPQVLPTYPPSHSLSAKLQYIPTY